MRSKKKEKEKENKKKKKIIIIRQSILAVSWGNKRATPK